MKNSDPINLETEGNLPIISVIVLNYNGRKYLDDCFNSINGIVYPQDKYEVLMVDNSSSDGSIDHVRDRFPWVKILPLHKNLGFTGGNNLGAKFAKGNYVVFLNNDVVVDKDWLIELVKVAINNPDAIVTSKALFLDNPSIINHDGAKATLIGRGFCLNLGKKDRSVNGFSTKFVIQPYGASMLVRKDVFEEIGAFDEDYFSSLEDLDLGLRAWLNGKKVIYTSNSRFYHVAGGTGGLGSHQSDVIVYHGTKNSYMNILKCFDFSHVFIGLALSLAFYTEMAIWFVGKSRLRAAKLTLLAHFWIVKNMGSTMRKRADIKKKRKVNYSYLFQSDFFASLPEMLREHKYLRTEDFRIPHVN